VSWYRKRVKLVPPPVRGKKRGGSWASSARENNMVGKKKKKLALPPIASGKKIDFPRNKGNPSGPATFSDYSEKRGNSSKPRVNRLGSVLERKKGSAGFSARKIGLSPCDESKKGGGKEGCKARRGERKKNFPST